VAAAAAVEGSARALTCRESDYLLFFSDRGRVCALPAALVPEAPEGKPGRGAATSAGTPLPQLIGFGPNETLVACIPVSPAELRAASPDGPDGIVLLTAQGQLKRLSLAECASLRAAGAAVIRLGDSSDVVRSACRCAEGDTLLLAASDGAVLRLVADGEALRAQGRAAKGVKGMALAAEARCVALELLPQSRAADASLSLLTLSARGHAKRTPVGGFKPHARGGGGNLGLKLPPGDTLVAARLLGLDAAAEAGLELVVTSAEGRTERFPVAAIPEQLRTARGKALLARLAEGDAVRSAGLWRPTRETI